MQGLGLRVQGLASRVDETHGKVEVSTARRAATKGLTITSVSFGIELATEHNRVFVRSLKASRPNLGRKRIRL